ncbi:fasciclin [Elysia marginata]|uniref:Fasciclin n=1 Tax=Elysia marginata TaxID=1093978 RepID=A0AAV4HS50_9GAST|nr:fasciclin [Elysia marginata]
MKYISAHLVTLALLAVCQVSWAAYLDQTVLECLKTLKRDTLVDLINNAGLTATLNDPSHQTPITLFAPNEDAFQELGALVQDLLTKPDLLREILKYHVVPGSIYRGAMHNTQLHTFEEADMAYLHGAGGVDGARFKTYDLSATNGVVHIISRVLIPASIKDQL